MGGHRNGYRQQERYLDMSVQFCEEQSALTQATLIFIRARLKRVSVIQTAEKFMMIAIVIG